jgi:hypothetical protein
MGKMSGGTGGGILAGDGSDIKGGDDSEDPSTSQKVLGGIGGAIHGALASRDQQPLMVQAGPQLGAPVNQPQQMQDPYGQYGQQLQQLEDQTNQNKDAVKRRLDFWGNQSGSGY